MLARAVSVMTSREASTLRLVTTIPDQSAETLTWQRPCEEQKGEQSATIIWFTSHDRCRYVRKASLLDVTPKLLLSSLGSE